jgi:hypothetical protein
LRGRLNVELYNNEREIRGLDNVLDLKLGYVIGELISTVDTNEKEELSSSNWSINQTAFRAAL